MPPVVSVHPLPLCINVGAIAVAGSILAMEGRICNYHRSVCTVKSLQHRSKGGRLPC